MDKNINNKKNIVLIICHILLLVVLIGVDQLTKIMAVNNLKNKKSYVMIRKILSFDYIENRGAAWNFMSGKTVLLSVVTIIVVSLLILLYFKLIIINSEFHFTRFTVLQWVIIILCAGAIGNLIDRITRGYVVDFIRVEFIDFPTFNLADCYVTVTAVLLVIILLFFISDEDLGLITRKKQK